MPMRVRLAPLLSLFDQRKKFGINNNKNKNEKTQIKHYI